MEAPSLLRFNKQNQSLNSSRRKRSQVIVPAVMEKKFCCFCNRVQWQASAAQPDILISLAYHGPSSQRGCRAGRNPKAGRVTNAIFARSIFLALHQSSRVSQACSPLISSLAVRAVKIGIKSHTRIKAMVIMTTCYSGSMRTPLAQ